MSTYESIISDESERRKERERGREGKVDFKTGT
jgi:hypothetical protein